MVHLELKFFYNHYSTLTGTGIRVTELKLATQNRKRFEKCEMLLFHLNVLLFLSSQPSTLCDKDGKHGQLQVLNAR